MNETQLLIHNIGAYSYLGVFVVAVLANVVIPVPEEIVILAIGYVIGTGKVSAYITVPLVILGLSMSDSLMYLLARRGTKFLTAFYNRFFAKSLGSKKEWVENHTKEMVFYTRFMMQFRFLGPFLAGQRKVPYKTFIKYELAALVIYVPVLLILGDYFQDRLEFIISGVGIVRNIFLIIVGIILLVVFSRFIHDITFGDFKLGLKGTKEERTWIPGIYKNKK